MVFYNFVVKCRKKYPDISFFASASDRKYAKIYVRVIIWYGFCM
ncbi:Uncharacterized protein dnm_025160 [Desulfonema magnum]|uniref:Uncharacterized protein n=1 Tax=Desulfonema magnum TaxID=45655 RepID=A0A975BJI6_9BACT|nr:Uncharacterized protein dnm_025160 [Desulfonema magnum]